MSASLKRASHYSRTTTKHGGNKSFVEKIVSSRNTMKTVLHIIHLLSKVLCLSLLLQFVQKIPLSLSWRPARLVKQDETSFVKICFTKRYETLSTHHL